MKWIKYHVFHTAVFLEYVLSVEGISANQEVANKMKKWPIPQTQKELNFWAQPPIIADS